MSKVVFVGNVPYNMGEEQLIDVFKSVGQVVGFRLVFDRDTGKPRGYGFCEFADHETAQSAVRNLNNVDVGGRPLRIDLADSDPFLEGKTTVRGELLDGGETRAQWRERELKDEYSRGPHGPGYRGGGVGPDFNPNFTGRKDDRDAGPKDSSTPAFLRNLPQGTSVPPGANALDVISQTLATMNPTQLIEVLAQFKAFVITHPEPARALLVAHPQLAYALFQALLLNKIVDPGILQRMLAATNPNAAPPPAPAPVPAPAPPPRAAPPPQHFPPPAAMHQHAPPPPQYHAPPQQQQQPPPAPAPYYHTPPPMNYGYPPRAAPQQQQPPPPPPPQQQQAPPQQLPAQGAPAGLDSLAIDPAQRAMLLQVLSLTQEQIAQLAPQERDTVMTLRNQLGGLV
ncbi:hypothetical protein FA95DRAFT_640061 [Auriscalpium vulgare]|uniref:Uncharacterized protein n=1 Tax=Auriscalpium vulgare TaxID=40419 RepID=A0ACB8S1F3_9AGAM|nr:hypothetical protein FA95DRAFT_640061 [Auriscalpium vulgare]